MKKQSVAESRDYGANGAIIIGQVAITQSRRTARGEYTDETNNNITETGTSMWRNNYTDGTAINNCERSLACDHDNSEIMTINFSTQSQFFSLFRSK